MAPGNLIYQLIPILLICSDAADEKCRPVLVVTTPTPMEALAGSCLNIPCTYEPSFRIDPSVHFTAIWFKNKQEYNKYDPSAFSVSGDKGKSYPMNITGNLANKDCTTMFHDISAQHQGNYYFRIENTDKATASCFLRISVKDSAWNPSMHIIGDQTEAEVVTIVCSAVTPCPRSPPRLTWDPHQGTANTPETNPDRTIKTTSRLDITLTDSHDGQVIKCSAAYPVKGEVKMADNNVTLSVRYGPKDTSVRVSPSESLSVGQSVTLNCSSRAKPPVQGFTWFRLSPQGPVHVAEGDTYTFSICDAGDYYCEASNALGNGSSQRIQLRITDAPGSPLIEVSGDQTEAEVVTIVCSAVTPCPRSPPWLTWNPHQGTANTPETNPDGTITTRSTLNITLTDSHDGQVIKCSAAYPVKGEVKETESFIKLNITYGPKDTSVRVSPSESLSVGQSVTLNCSSRAKPPVQGFTWFRLSPQGPVHVAEGDTYTFSICDAGDYYCEASNALGNGSSQRIQLRITDAPGSPLIEVSGDQTEAEVVTIVCSAVTPCPRSPPRLTWNPHQGTANTPETNPDGTITTRSTLNITLTDSHDGQVIKCSAAYPVKGEVKETESFIKLNITYGPKDTLVQVSPTQSLSAGQSVIMRCSSRAKPPVQNFTWFRQSSQGPVYVGEGERYNFSFRNGVDFYCVATNVLGNESSPVVHLVMKVAGNKAILGAILGAVIGVLAVFALALFVWFKTKNQTQKNKQQEECVKAEGDTIHYGEIDFSAVKRKEASHHGDMGLKHETVYSEVRVPKANPVEETAQYAEISFSTPGPKGVSEKARQEEAVYSEVHKFQSGGGGDDLYAKVNRN